MNHVLRFIFDNTSSPRLAEDLARFYNYDHPELEVTHLKRKFRADAKDPEWLPALQQEGGWIVISGDRGATSGTHKLPMICKSLGITHLLISGTIQQRGYSATKQAIAETWRDIIKLAALPPGTKASLRYRGHRSEEMKPIILVGGLPLAKVEIAKPQWGRDDLFESP